MAGLILIEDPTDWSVPQHIKDVSCPSNCEHDIELIFQSTLIYSDGGFAYMQMMMQDNLFRWAFRALFIFISFLFLVHAEAIDGLS